MNEDHRQMSMNPPYSVADFLQIALGKGEIEMGAAWHEGIPGLWFGIQGQGIGATRERNEFAADGETLAIIKIPDVRSLEVLEKTVAETRALVEQFAEGSQ